MMKFLRIEGARRLIGVLWRVLRRYGELKFKNVDSLLRYIVAPSS